MIARFPLRGVGPGNFQDYYTQFKLPEASEEVGDPHNFVLEVWATAGTLAFLALVAVLAIVAWTTWEVSPRRIVGEPDESEHDGESADENSAESSVDRAASQPHVTAHAEPDDASDASVRFLLGGSAVGLLVAYLAGLPFGMAIVFWQLGLGLVVGLAVVGLAWPWIDCGRLPARLAGLGLLVLAINLLAAGGIAFPGVAGTFWLLAALQMNVKSCQLAVPIANQRWRRAIPLTALAASLALMVACYQTAFLPVLSCRAALSRASDVRISDAKREAAMIEATKADPLSSEPWLMMAELSLAEIKKDPTSELWVERFSSAVQAMHALRHHSSSGWRQIGLWYRELRQLTRESDFDQRIVELTRGAADLYPNSALLRGEYALALRESNSVEGAQRAARRALELDELTPHRDKKLPLELKQQLQAIMAEPLPSRTPPEKTGTDKPVPDKTIPAKSAPDKARPEQSSAGKPGSDKPDAGKQP